MGEEIGFGNGRNTYDRSKATRRKKLEKGGIDVIELYSVLRNVIDNGSNKALIKKIIDALDKYNYIDQSTSKISNWLESIGIYNKADLKKLEIKSTRKSVVKERINNKKPGQKIEYNNLGWQTILFNLQQIALAIQQEPDRLVLENETELSRGNYILYMEYIYLNREIVRKYLPKKS